MKNINKLQKLSLACLITLFISTPAFCDNSGSAAANDEVTTTLTTNRNGQTTTETTTGYANGNTGGGTTGTGNTGGGTTGTGTTGTGTTGTGTTGTGATDGNTDADDVNYTGVYKGHQVLPDLMMIYCKVNAEDIIQDLSKLEDCIKKYVTAINNSNASIKAQGIHDFNTLRYKTLVDVAATAITKLASVANYEETMNKYAEATAQTKTNFDTETALTNTQAFSTDVMNSIRELYADILKYQAIDGMVNIDPSVILDEDEELDENGNIVKSGGGTTADQTTENTRTGITAGEGEGAEEIGGDGENEIIDGGELGEVTVNGSSKLDKYEKMTPEEFAQHKDEVEQLRKALTDAMNDPDATDTEIANAQRALERLGEIEAQKAAWGGDDDFEEVTDVDYEHDGSTQLQEVTVTGSSKIDKYEQMTPEEFAQHKDEVEQLRRALTEAMNDPDATDGEIANAQRALERLANIEAQQAAAANAANNNASTNTNTPTQHDSDLAAAQNLSQSRYVDALNAYRRILEDSGATDEQKSQAQYYIDVLTEAAPTVFSDKPCAQMKRELGLNISCYDWNHQ